MHTNGETALLARLFRACCRTPADESNDRTTLDRALDDRLVLIVKPNPGAAWGLPESAWQVRRLVTQTRSFDRLAVVEGVPPFSLALPLSFT